MSAPGTSSRMRELWADPEWAMKMREKQAAGQRKRWAKNPTWGKSSAGTPISRQITTAFDPETYMQLRSLAIRQNKSLGELVRTFVEWGLETEGET